MQDRELENGVFDRVGHSRRGREGQGATRGCGSVVVKGIGYRYETSQTRIHSNSDEVCSPKFAREVMVDHPFGGCGPAP